ncbi:MAG: cation-translocating P-type ATPase [Planctomycetes bacterium]|nr:cation-translocating P-type ATPase [Planctomycetota bacterium]
MSVATPRPNSTTSTSPTPPYRQTVEEVLARFDTDPRRGLTNAEAAARLATHGRNELLSEPAIPAWYRFVAQFTNLLVILLLIAAAISATIWLLERKSAFPYEALAILAVVILNAVMGFVQESRAETAMAALREMTAAEATVVRDGERRRVPAAEVVPGDLILIEEGDAIPADARLIREVALEAAEAALTGESLAVSKDTAPVFENAPDVVLGDRINMVFSGTSATYGHGAAVVTATGMLTEMGRIAGMMRSTAVDITPLQRELNRVGKVLGGVVIAIAVGMIVTIVLVEEVRGLSALFEVLILGVALAVAAVPEGLPAVVTAVLAIGVQRLAGRHAIVRNLAAVETLGSASVIASDKTGTLTRNEMTVRTVVTATGRVGFGGSGYSPEGGVFSENGTPIGGDLLEELQRALTVADRANNATLHESAGRWTVQGDPTEGALLVAARKAGLASGVLEARFERIGEVPFSSERKLMTTVHSDADRQGRLLAFTKGAPDVVVVRCTQEYVGASHRPMSDDRRAQILREAENLAGHAMRTLAVAARELPASATAHIGNAGRNEADEGIEQELAFLGLIGMIDPPREEAERAVEKAKGAGIRPIMITGDHPRTAAVIARELGIATDERVVTGAELAVMSDAALAQTVREVSVYARVDPEHKLRIVRALQSEAGGAAVVAMTGDGVNDAPALKAADIGVAMGMTGTDVSKQAADVVLTDDNFATIVAAVEGGRSIYANIRKFLRYLLSSNIGEVMTMFFGVMLAKLIGLHSHSPANLETAGESGIVLPLLATHVLWINLVTDGLPAMALGLEPADPDAMTRPPRPRNERVITAKIWIGIFLVGAIMAVGTLLVLDSALPGGMIDGTGTLRHAQTMAFTTLVLFQLFNVFNARSDVRSAFEGAFSNRWLWAAVGVSLALQAAVIHVPLLRSAFSTTNLSAGDWIVCLAVSSSVLWLRELGKAVARFETGGPQNADAVVTSMGQGRAGQ